MAEMRKKEKYNNIQVKLLKSNESVIVMIIMLLAIDVKNGWRETMKMSSNILMTHRKWRNGIIEMKWKELMKSIERKIIEIIWHNILARKLWQSVM